MKKIELKALQLGASEILTKEQLKNALGGEYELYACQCLQHVGQWTGQYWDQASANASIQNYCTGGGTCSKVTTVDPGGDPPLN